MKVIIVAGLSMLLGAVCVQASEENVVIGDIEMPAVDSSMAFKQVEKKVGKWEGKMTQGAHWRCHRCVLRMANDLGRQHHHRDPR